MGNRVNGSALVVEVVVLPGQTAAFLQEQEYSTGSLRPQGNQYDT